MTNPISKMTVRQRVALARVIAAAIVPWILLWDLLLGVWDWLQDLWRDVGDLPSYIGARTAQDLNTLKVVFSKNLIEYNETLEKETDAK